MLKTRITSSLLISILLSGCNFDDSNDTENVGKTDDVTNDVVILTNYTISSDHHLSTLPIEREYTESFSLDSLKIEYNPSGNTLTLTNNTPRYFSDLTLDVDGKFYMLEANFSPFEHQTFDVEHLNATVIKFHDEQPFFRILMNGYNDHQNSDEVGLASEDNAYQYEQEIRAYKNVFNDLDFIVHGSQYLTDYGSDTATRSTKMQTFLESQGFDEIECSHPSHLARSGTDTSPSYTKILSMLMHQPTSVHYLLLKNYNGLATIGNGWLSVRDFRLYQNGQTVPKTTYLHEKHHNHSFGHSGGMTYGIPDVLINYINNGEFNEDYYEAEKLAKKIPTAVASLAIESVDVDYLDLVFSFWSQDENVLTNTPYVNRFYTVMPEGVEFVQAQLDLDKSIKTVKPSLLLADNRAMLFDLNDSLKIRQFGEQDLGTKSDELRLRISRPAAAQKFAFMASGNPASWALQANLQVEVGTEHGLKTDEGQVVFTTPNEYHGEDGVLVTEEKLYTPEEAIEFCADNNLTLGKLKTYKSTDQMNFQMAYLPYKSQVGIDPDTLEAVAVAVTSSYRPDYVNYTDAGALIVCE